MVPIYVINRSCDTERLARITAGARRHGFDFEVIEAVDGHAEAFDLRDHAHDLRNGWFGKATVKPGAFACFLSHIKFWNLVVARRHPAALVLEDDARVLRRIPDLARLVDRHDLLYVNYRVARWANRGRWLNFGVAEFDPAMRAIVEDGRKPRDQGLAGHPGTDGYALSGRGARYLLDKVARHGMLCAVDHFMVGAVTRRATIDRLAPEHLGRYVGFGSYRILADPEPIPTGVLRRPLVRAGGMGSIVQHDVRQSLDAGQA